MPRFAASLRNSAPSASSPTTVHRPARAPSATRHFATFAAPPSMNSSRSTASTGTGASGEMRSTSPMMYASSVASPTTTTRRPTIAPSSSRMRATGGSRNSANAGALDLRRLTLPSPRIGTRSARSRRTPTKKSTGRTFEPATSSPALERQLVDRVGGRRSAGPRRERISRARISTSKVQFTQKGSSNSAASCGPCGASASRRTACRRSAGRSTCETAVAKTRPR